MTTIKVKDLQAGDELGGCKIIVAPVFVIWNRKSRTALTLPGPQQHENKPNPKGMFCKL
jgi:hypothetical protein